MAKQKVKVSKYKPKGVLGKELFVVRKQMSKDLKKKWYERAIKQDAELSENTFRLLTTGTYISKDNTMLALDLLREGKKLLNRVEKDMNLELKRMEKLGGQAASGM